MKTKKLGVLNTPENNPKDGTLNGELYTSMGGNLQSEKPTNNIVEEGGAKNSPLTNSSVSLYYQYLSNISSSYYSSTILPKNICNENRKESVENKGSLSGISNFKEGKILTFFEKTNSVFVPKKTEATIIKYIPKKLLKSIDKNQDIAIDKCMLFISFLTSTIFTEFSESRYKRLQSSTLHSIFKKNKGNTYIYTKVIAALTKGTAKGAIIEVDNSYKVGHRSKSYKLADTYFRVGVTAYTFKSDEVREKRKEIVIEALKKTLGNPIVDNLLCLYSTVTLPTEEQLLEKARVLVENKYETKKGKRLTFRDGRTDSQISNLASKSLVEDNLELYKYLTGLDFVVPIVGDERSGGRVVDSFTLMPSWIRKEVKISNEDIAEVDFTALHPNIAMTLFGGDMKYLTHQSVSELSGIDKSKVKVEHLSFFNKPFVGHKTGDKFIPGMNDSKLFDYYSTHQPTMMENIFNDKKEFGHNITFARMAKLETEIMTEVIRRLNKQGICVGYVYDALFCKQSEATSVQEVMNEVVIEKGVYTTANIEDTK